MTLRTLILRYAFFAILAIVANLMTQRLVMWFGESSTLFLFAVGLGTFVGLIIKYILDKRWIFYDVSNGAKTQGQKFVLYTAMGLVTTALFWTTETLFWLVWQTHLMRELGAIIGLVIGYIVKYNLDRRFVFTNAQLVQTS